MKNNHILPHQLQISRQHHSVHENPNDPHWYPPALALYIHFDLYGNHDIHSFSVWRKQIYLVAVFVIGSATCSRFSACRWL